MESTSVFFLLLASSASLFFLGRAAPEALSAQAKALNFMRKYGYIEGGGDGAQPLLSNGSYQNLVEAIKEVQRFGGLQQTGELDETTQKLMSSKRCGVADIIKDSSRYIPEEKEGIPDGEHNEEQHQHHRHHHHHHQHHHEHHSHDRRKRYILASKGWNKRHLTYYLDNWSRSLTREETVYAVETALGVWSKYGRLHFSAASDPSKADINIGFYKGYHGDAYPFDGAGLVLAHAFYPTSSSHFEGDVHFDDEENWSIESRPEDGIDLLSVAVHELGHSLGLSHSPDKDSVMNPYYSSGGSRELGYDDILAMYNLYVRRRLDDDGNEEEVYTTPRPVRPPPTRTTTTSSTTPRREETTAKRKDLQGSWHGAKPQDGCNGAFDAVTYIRGELFVIKKKMLWRLRGPGQVQPGYPVEFRRFFDKLPESVKRIDAIYERSTDSSIVIFTGHQFWVFDGRALIENSPRPITDYGLPWSMDKVDGVTNRNGTTYIFTDLLYWMYDDKTRRLVKGSPRPISDWGFPASVDSIMTYKDGKTYIFKGDQYWVYDNRLTIPTTLPRSASDFWLAC